VRFVDDVGKVVAGMAVKEAVPPFAADPFPPQKIWIVVPVGYIFELFVFKNEIAGPVAAFEQAQLFAFCV
jgi:hypothetical protein